MNLDRYSWPARMPKAQDEIAKAKHDIQRRAVIDDRGIWCPVMDAACIGDCASGWLPCPHDMGVVN